MLCSCHYIINKELEVLLLVKIKWAERYIYLRIVSFICESVPTYMWEKNHGAFISDLIFLHDTSLGIIPQISYEFVSLHSRVYVFMFQK